MVIESDSMSISLYIGVVLKCNHGPAEVFVLDSINIVCILASAYFVCKKSLAIHFYLRKALPFRVGS